MRFKLGLSRLMRWILLLSIFFVLLLFLLRTTLYLWFPRPGNGATSSLPAFNLGFHYDIRWVSLVALVTLVLGSIPLLNPFKKKICENKLDGGFYVAGPRANLFLCF